MYRGFINKWTVSIQAFLWDTDYNSKVCTCTCMKHYHYCTSILRGVNVSVRRGADYRTV